MELSHGHDTPHARVYMRRLSRAGVLARRRPMPLLLIVVTAFAIAAAGCGAPANGPLPGSPSDADSPWQSNRTSAHQDAAGDTDPAEVEFFVSASPVETAIIEEILDGFATAHPDVPVRLVNARRDYATVLLTRMAGGDAPDVVLVDGKWTSDWIGRGILQPLDDHIAGSKLDTAAFVPQLVDAARGQDGKLYGIPSTYSTLGLMVNDDLLADAGLKRPPRNWAELSDYADRLTSDGTVGLCLVPTWERMYAFALQNGAGIVSPDGTRMSVRDEAMVDTFRWIAGMMERPSVAQPQELGASWCGDALGKGLAAMVLEGAWLLPPMARQYPEVRYSVHPLPAGRRPATLAYMGMFSMTSTAQHPDGAWKLLEYLGSAHSQRVWARAGLALPARTDIRPPARLVPFRSAVDTATVWKVPPGFYNTVLMTIDNEFSAVMEGDRTVDEMVINIDTVGKTILGQGQTP